MCLYRREALLTKLKGIDDDDDDDLSLSLCSFYIMEIGWH